MLSPIELEREMQRIIDDSSPNDFDAVAQKLFYDTFDIDFQIQCLKEVAVRIKVILQDEYSDDTPESRSQKKVYADRIHCILSAIAPKPKD